jgi:hypothetical protein
LFSEFPFKACFDKGTMKTKITRKAGLLWLCRSPKRDRDPPVGGEQSLLTYSPQTSSQKCLLGSQYYTENPAFSLEKTLVDINLDMIGRSKLPSDTGNFAGFDLSVTQPGEIMVYTSHESSELIKMMDSAALEAGVKLIDKGKDLEFGGSDHESFRAKGVPAFFFHSGIHADLHNTGDDVAKIDFDKMEEISKMVFLLGYKAANQRKRIEIDKLQLP